MLNVGASALITAQGSLSTTSHNISNVNTEGYNRQIVEQGTRLPNFEGGYYIGSGVNITSVERRFDDFLADQVRIFTSQEQQLDTFSAFARQVDDLLGAPELSLSSGLQGFFNAVQDVADDPTSIPARQVMLTEADTLSQRFNTLDSQLTAFSEQVNSNLDTAIKDVNVISAGIANLNKAITEALGGNGTPPNDLLDQRDRLINELSTYLSVTSIEQSNGSMNIFVGKGQGIVVGQSAIELSVTTDPADTSRFEVGYGPSNINISSQLTGGTVGGLLTVRQDVIDPARSEIDALAVGMIDNVNAQHTVGITLSGNAGGNFFEPADPAIQGAGSIRLAITDPRDIAVAFPVVSSKSQTNTGTAGLEINTVTALSNPVAAQAINSDITFSFDSVANSYTVSYQGETATLPYNPSTDSGKTFDMSTLVFSITPPAVTAPTAPSMTITLTGVPVEADQFTMSNSVDGLGNFTAVGDNRNALEIGDLQIAKILNGNSESFGDSYGILVANVATRTHQADVNQKTQKGLLEQTNLRYESVSGVNLDEEAASLIKYQQAYQAASQIITVSNTVFNSLINAM